MTLHEIAELQSLYAQLFLADRISEEVYRASVHACHFAMQGYNTVTLETIARDLRELTKIKDLIPKVRAKCESSRIRSIP